MLGGGGGWGWACVGEKKEEGFCKIGKHSHRESECLYLWRGEENFCKILEGCSLCKNGFHGWEGEREDGGQGLVGGGVGGGGTNK